MVLPVGSGLWSASSSVPEQVQSPPRVESVTINDGSAQRSKVKSITVVFDRMVKINSGAFQLYRQGSGKPIPVQARLSQSDGYTVALLTFKGHGVVGNSLANGQYRLIIRGDKIRDPEGRRHDGDGDGQEGGNYVFSFFRRFGDSDGDGDLDRRDKDAFFAALGQHKRDPGYMWYLDYNANRKIWAEDLTMFLLSFRKNARCD